MPNYTAAQFDEPKVKGLAIHNAKLAANKARVRYDERDRNSSSFFVLPDEIQSYCLYIVNPDCSVQAVASSATSADFAKFIGVSNLAALASKYKPIGFVAQRDWQSPKRAEMVAIKVPLRRGK